MHDFYSVETAMIRTAIGVKLNNSAKQAHKTKEGGRMGGLDGGAGGAGTKASTPAKTANLDQEKLDDQSVDMYGD